MRTVDKRTAGLSPTFPLFNLAPRGECSFHSQPENRRGIVTVALIHFRIGLKKPFFGKDGCYPTRCLLEPGLSSSPHTARFRCRLCSQKRSDRPVRFFVILETILLENRVGVQSQICLGIRLAIELPRHVRYGYLIEMTGQLLGQPVKNTKRIVFNLILSVPLASH